MVDFMGGVVGDVLRDPGWLVVLSTRWDALWLDFSNYMTAGAVGCLTQALGSTGRKWLPVHPS